MKLLVTLSTISYFMSMAIFKGSTSIDKNNNPAAAEGLFLPNFCGMRVVFVVVVIAQLCAIVLTLAPMNVSTEGRWYNLAMISLFVQWAALSSSGVLCLARPYLNRYTNREVGLISYSLILLVIAILSEAAYWLVYHPAPYGGPNAHWLFLLRNLMIGAIVAGLVLRYFYVQQQWRARMKTESQSRLQALQSRIRPHFLFNSMNTIASLTRSDPKQAEVAVENLADLFRISLGDARASYTLKEELELCRRYLEIEALRLGDRLKLEWQLETLPMDARVPPLLLQPLLENAVYHGVEAMMGGGTITIHGERNGRYLVINIQNPIPPSPQSSHQRGNRLAMDNIRERLQAVYEKQGKLMIEQKEGHYSVSVHFPYKKHDDEDPDRG